MTDQTSPGPSPEPGASPPPPPGPEAGPPPSSPTFEQRMERFGQEAEEAGKRLASNPTVVEAADTAGRVWGLILLAVGLWFFAEVTLGYELPSLPWRDIWPLGLILVGLVVVVRGMARRRA